MTKGERNESAGDVDAIKRVLEAEHLAEQQLRRCHQEARQLLEDAREKARAIEARADERVHRIHRDRQERISRLRKETERQCHRLDAQPPCDEGDAALIDRVVDEAVERLLSLVDEDLTG